MENFKSNNETKKETLGIVSESLKKDIIKFTIDTNRDFDGDIIYYEGNKYYVDCNKNIVFLIEKER